MFPSPPEWYSLGDNYFCASSTVDNIDDENVNPIQLPDV